MSDAESRAAFWRKKIAAYLHDPPSKVFDIEGHEGVAVELIMAALGESKSQAKKKLLSSVKGADVIASAADRECVDGEDVEVDWAGVIRHPMSGAPMPDDTERPWVTDIPNADVASAAAKKAVASLPNARPEASPEELREVYVQLWRRLQDTMGEQAGWWDRIPATTRMPDFSIWEHMESVATVAGALPNPCQLIFQIGPVQEFIMSARRTQDFWAGSYLISYLTWQAIKTITDKLGPDAILYPSMRGQPLLDRELGLDEERLEIASLPHRFVALVPADEAEKLATDASEAVRREWQMISDAVRDSINEWAGSAWHDGLDTVWKNQIEQLWQVSWSAYTWPRPDEDRPNGNDWATLALAEHDELLPSDGGDEDEFHRALRFFRGSPERIGQVQVGTCYSRIHTVAERCIGSVRASGTFGPEEHQGELCTCCGQRATLSAEPKKKDDGKMEKPREAAKGFWEQIAGRLQSEDRHREVKPDGAERLCAVCSVKRFAQREYLEAKLGLGNPFPSTSTIAVADFMNELIEKAAGHSELAEVVKVFADAIGSTKLPPTHERSWLPYFDKRLEKLPEDVRSSIDTLLKYDGDIFFPEFYEEDRLKREFGDDRGKKFHDRLAAKDVDAVGKLKVLREAWTDAGIAPPAKYYAVIAFDGDEMGKWLTGENAPQLQDLIAPKVLQTEGFREAWAEVLKLKRFVSPSFHKVISAALGAFALRLVPHIVEEKYPAKLVYAGGDDVMLLAPARVALEIAEDLRFAFTGQGKWDAGEWKSDPTDDTGFIDKDGRVLCMMGSTASASAGIAFSHHTQPMIRAISTAHEECEAAKERYNRNALSVAVLKRGGELLRAGGKFHNMRCNGTPRLVEVVRLAIDLFSDTATGSLSRGLPSTLQESADVIAALDDLPEAQDAEFKRVLDRQINLPKPPDSADEETKARYDKLTEEKTDLRDGLLRLMCYWRGLEKERREEAHDDDETTEGGPLPAYLEMVNWLLVARFLSTGGGDE